MRALARYAKTGISIHALREEGDAQTCTRVRLLGYFYPRPPRGGRRSHGFRRSPGESISIHALREEGDRFRQTTVFTLANFYPRPPRGGRPRSRTPKKRADRFLSTPSARRATWTRSKMRRSVSISIHALREEGDKLLRRIKLDFGDFYPRPPRGGRQTAWCWKHRSWFYFYPRPPRGGRPKGSNSFLIFWGFLSTPSARRATSGLIFFILRFLISIHALREEGDCGQPQFPQALAISIHALREEGDQAGRFDAGRSHKFLSTPSARRATTGLRQKRHRSSISIHALREEGDLWPWRVDSPQWGFLSTPSARRATPCLGKATCVRFNFYPRPPRGGRQPLDGWALDCENFYPRPPRGGRRVDGVSVMVKAHFYPRPPRGGRPPIWISPPVHQRISIHALREEGDSWHRMQNPPAWYFYPRPPRGGRRTDK